MNLHRRHLKEGQRHMIGARWADAKIGRFEIAAHAQQTVRTAVTVASEMLKIGERGIYHTKVVISQETPEEIAAPQSEPRKPLGGTRKPRRGGEDSSGARVWRV